MKANLSKELEMAINEKIMFDLQVHALDKKISKEQRAGEEPKALELLLKNRIKQLREINTFLHKNNVKVSPPKRRDDIFIDYYISQKVDGGYKEGIFTYWDIVLKQRTQKRLNTKDGTNEGSKW